VLFRDVTEQTRYPSSPRRVYIWPKASTKGDLYPLTPTARRLRQLPVRLRKRATNVNSRPANPLQRISLFSIMRGEIYDTDLHCHWSLNRRHCRDCICDRTGRRPVPKNPIHVDNLWISSARGALLGPCQALQLAVLFPPTATGYPPRHGKPRPQTASHTHGSCVELSGLRRCRFRYVSFPRLGHGGLGLSAWRRRAHFGGCFARTCRWVSAGIGRIMALSRRIKTDQRMPSVAR
jgi:hypothetical protein